MPTIRSDLPFDIGAYASTVFQLIPFRAMNASRTDAVKHVALSETTTRGSPKQWIISSFTSLSTSYAVEVAVALATGQPVRCSTAESVYFFLVAVRGIGPAKYTEYVSKKDVIGKRRVFLYFSIGLAL